MQQELAEVLKPEIGLPIAAAFFVACSIDLMQSIIIALK
jgi:hypothetical protein